MFGICRLASVVFSCMSFRGCFVGLTSFSSLPFFSVFFVSFVFVCPHLLCCPFLRCFSSQLELSSITFQLLVHLRSPVSFCDFLGFSLHLLGQSFLEGKRSFWLRKRCCSHCCPTICSSSCEHFAALVSRSRFITMMMIVL